MKNWIDDIGVSEKGNYLVAEKAICMVTHPNIPDHSGLARGRAIHLTSDGEKSVCNMNVDILFKQQNFLRSKRCKICFKEYKS